MIDNTQLNLVKKYFFRIAKNSLWIGISETLHKASIFIATIIITRYYSVSDMGRIVYILNFTNFFMALSDMGLSAVGLRNMCRLKNKEQYWNKLFTVRMLFAPIVLLAWIFLVIFNSNTPHIKTMAFFGISYSLFFILRDFFIIRFRAEEKIHFEAISKLFGTLIFITGIYLCSINSCNIENLFVFYPLSTFITLIFTVLLLRFVGSSLKWNWDKIFYKKIMKDSLPIMVSFFLFFLFLKADMFFIYNILGERISGLYQICVNIVTVMVSFIMILIMGAFPVMSQKFGKNKLKKKFAIGVSFVLIGIGFISYFLITHWNTNIITLLYGEKNVDATSIFKWYGLFIPPYFAINFINYYLVAVDAQKKIITMYIVSVILIPLIPFLIKLYGINGASIAVSIIGYSTFFTGIYLIGSIKKQLIETKQ